MPPYDQWPTGWPPLAASLLAAAEETGADYVMMGNAYGYGPVDGPITEDLPLVATTSKGTVRARMWLDTLASYDAGRVRVTEVRAHDFLGPNAVSYYTFTVQPAVLAGQPATYVPADPRRPPLVDLHSRLRKDADRREHGRQVLGTSVACPEHC